MHSGLPSQGSILRIPSNLKTTSANTPEVLVRFFNVTSRDVDLIWINQKGFGIRYAKLAKSRHIDIRTFEGHYWILRESGTGTPLLAQIYFSPTTWEKFEVYTPARRDPANPRVVCRTSVFVRSPERTLADLCIRTVLKHNSNVDAVAQLPLPGNLITILLEAAYHTHFYQRYFNIFPDIVARTAALPREDPEVLMITDAEVIDYSRMTPPEKKTKKLTNNVEAKKIKELVEEALQKDDTKARWEAIKLLRQQGHLHEIAKVYVQLISDNDLIELSDEDMLQLDDYFSLMTSNTASSYYKLLTDAVDKHNDNVKKLGNIVRLLSYMILKVDLVSNVAFTELLSNDLITLIHDRIPYFTGKGMILHLCRTYAYVLETLGRLKEVDYFAERWEHVYKNELLKSPYMAFLTVLVGQEPEELEQRMADAYGIEATDSFFSEKYQLYLLAATHYNCFVEKLTDEFLRCLTVLILSEARRKNELVAMVGKLRKDYIFHSRSKKLSALFFDAVFIVTSDAYSDCDKDDMEIGRWTRYASSVLKKNEENYLYTMLTKFSDMMDERTVKLNKENTTIEQVLTVLEMIQDMSISVKCYDAIMYFFIVLLTLFAKSRSKHFFRCFQVAGLYFAHPEHYLEINKITRKFMTRYWVPAFCQLHSIKNEICSREFFCETLANFAYRNIEDFEGKETLFKYVKKDSAEVNIMRFMLKMKSPVVSRNPRIKFNVDNPVTPTYANSNSIKISMKMGAVYRNVVESTQNEQLDLELELYLMTALTHMKRSDRVEMLKEYYAEEDYRKVTKFVRDILMGDVPVPAKEVAVVIRRAYAIFSTVCPSFELPDYNMNDLVNWKSIALLYRCDPNLLSAFVHRTKTNLLFDLLETYDKIEDSNIVAPLVGALLNKAMIEADHEKFTVYCHRVAELGIKNKDMLQFLTKVVEVSAGTKAEYSLLALVLCVASTMKLSESNIVGHKHMTNFLVACIKLCPKTLLKNQCALFGSLITKHFKNAYMAINNQETSEKDADILRYGCSKLAEFLACNEKPVKRIVSFIISEVLMTAKSMELAFAKLHGICDTHSKALLAVALPPAEKKQYARLSKTLKRVYKPTV